MARLVAKGHAPGMKSGKPGQPVHAKLTAAEIRQRAIRFAREWKGESRERAEAQTFWNELFTVFGTNRRRFGVFEHPATKPDGSTGWADLLWPGVVLVEHKSRGASLDTAYSEGSGYLSQLPVEQIPRFVVVSDFEHFRVYDRDDLGGSPIEFKLEDLPKNTDKLSFLAEWRGTRPRVEPTDLVNQKAAELMGRLHDALAESGYARHDLEVLLVRLVFCMFADSTEIFHERGQFRHLIEDGTRGDGSDTGPALSQLFEVLNTEEGARQRALGPGLSSFRYINGKLFEERLATAAFTESMRDTLLDCCRYDWSGVSPAVFGSMFQTVMDSRERRQLGAHYTSESNIMKVLAPLFLDELKGKLEKCGLDKSKLRAFVHQLSLLRFLDPACGCGNFLSLAYRELRRLETQALVKLRKSEGDLTQHVIDVALESKLDVDAFFGIELMEFPARIAQVSLWLTDHLMNRELSDALGGYYVRLPLTHSPNIVVGNALTLDWGDFLPASDGVFVLGNPPYGGKQSQTEEQKLEIETLLGSKLARFGTLDYVACWFVKATDYISNTTARVGFVSTNAITHGEQVSPLWTYLLDCGVRIHFAHRAFHWSNEARGRAGVTVVVIGFGLTDVSPKRLYDYPPETEAVVELRVRNINPYLVDGPTVLLPSRRTPLDSQTPRMTFGSMPNDGGHLLLSSEERESIIQSDSSGSKLIRRLLGAREFLHSEARWCLWLKGCSAAEIARHPSVVERLREVRRYREASKRPTTRALSSHPSLFGEDRQPETNYVLVPGVSSERRHFVPMGFFAPATIATNSCLTIPSATLYHFGILQSEMHMAWVRQVCGRLRLDFRYSAEIVYNNFPWPDSPTTEERGLVERAARAVIRIRESDGGSLSVLYDPDLTPPPLVAAHKRLDAAVDRCYHHAPFKRELDRLRFLFERYEAVQPTIRRLDSFETPAD